MVNGAFKLSSNTDDLGFEGGDARLEVFYREGIEILACERGDGVVGTSRQDFLAVHGCNVDPIRTSVNKRGARFGANGGKCGAIA
jgi:hypothetical protein